MPTKIPLWIIIMTAGVVSLSVMAVILTRLRSVHEKILSRKRVALAAVIAFVSAALLLWGLDILLLKFHEMGFILAAGAAVLFLFLLYMRSVIAAWKWRKRNPSYALIRLESSGGFTKSSSAVILSIDGVPIQKSKAVAVVGKGIYILSGEHSVEMAGYTRRYHVSMPSFPDRERQKEQRVRFTKGRRYVLRYESSGRKLKISDNGLI